MNEVTTARCADCNATIPAPQTDLNEEIMPVCESCKAALLAEDEAARLDPRNFDPEYLKPKRSWESYAW